jgi:hypothetical protein
VNIALAILIVLVASTLAIAPMLWVRRKAPEGSYFNDGDRAAGVFGVLATGFAVLLGFVVFLAFTSYDTARAGAESEGVANGSSRESLRWGSASVCALRYVVPIVFASSTTAARRSS